jgi:hypothetical protein
VNHQIEYNVNVQASRRKSGKPVDFEKLRLCCKFARLSDNGIESFDMANLQHALARRGGVNQSAGLFQCRSHGFFNQHIDSVLKKVNPYPGVIRGGDCQARRVDPAEQFAIIRERRGFAERGDFLGSGFLDVGDAH